jgi:threonine/homoserine/homoserine lactone efflux protein
VPSGSALSVFIAATLVLLLTPGPAVLYIVARSVEQGRLAGVVSALGVGVGGLAHVMGAAVGLSALLVASSAAFGLIRGLGAAYLIFLGLRKLLGRDAVQSDPAASRRPFRRLFVDGVVVNVLNPKTALFFLAFLPQFVSPDHGHVTFQVVALGTLFLGLALCTDCAYAMLAGSVRQWAGGVRVATSGRYLSGTTYIGLGIGAALTGSRHR